MTTDQRVANIIEILREKMISEVEEGQELLDIIASIIGIGADKDNEDADVDEDNEDTDIDKDDKDADTHEDDQDANVGDVDLDIDMGAKASKEVKTKASRARRDMRGISKGNKEDPIAPSQRARRAKANAKTNKRNKSTAKTIKSSKKNVTKRQNESSSSGEANTTGTQVVTIEDVEKIAHTILVDTGAFEPTPPLAKTKKYETNEDFDLLKTRERIFKDHGSGRAKATKKRTKTKGGK